MKIFRHFLAFFCSYNRRTKKMPKLNHAKIQKKICRQPEIIFSAFTAFGCISIFDIFLKNLLPHFSKLDIFRMSIFGKYPYKLCLKSCYIYKLIWVLKVIVNTFWFITTMVDNTYSITGINYIMQQICV